LVQNCLDLLGKNPTCKNYIQETYAETIQDMHYEFLLGPLNTMHMVVPL